MKLTKAQLIDAIAATNGLTKRQSSESIDILLEIIKSTLASGEDAGSRNQGIDDSIL